MTGISDGVDDRLDQREIVALHRAVALDRGDEDLTCAAVFNLVGPVDHLAAGVVLPGVAEAAPTAAPTRSNVDAGDDALSAVAIAIFVDQAGLLVRRGVEADLVGASAQQVLNLVRGW